MVYPTGRAGHISNTKVEAKQEVAVKEEMEQEEPRDDAFAPD